MLPQSSERRRLSAHVARQIDNYFKDLASLPISSPISPYTIRSHLSQYDFETPIAPEAILDDAFRMLREWGAHHTHPRCFGLFNPTPAFMGVLADTMVAALNPQLAVWTASPAANETERHLVSFFGARFGYPSDRVAGHFTTGGAEANLTGVLLALTRTFPGVAEQGLRALSGQPMFYASAESHHAWLKIAHTCGLGRDAVRFVPVRADLRPDLEALRAQIAADRSDGTLPFLVIATAGTTSAGIVEPLAAIADLCAEEQLRLHVDAAWGGMAALSDRLRPILAGIERADSITVDAHKWLSAPMGAGLFLCTDQNGLHDTFRVSTAYMPPSQEDTVDPYVHSIQWSRRFIGLKVFMTLAVAGQHGIAKILDEQTRLGEELRRRLPPAGWQIVNDTPLPVICFRDARFEAPPDSPESAAHHTAIAASIAERGRVWLSATRLRGLPALRACITSYLTTETDLDALVAELDAVRDSLD